jgi:hypothetical protein
VATSLIITAQPEFVAGRNEARIFLDFGTYCNQTRAQDLKLGKGSRDTLPSLTRCQMKTGASDPGYATAQRRKLRQAESYERAVVFEKSSIYGHFRALSHASVHVCSRHFIGQSLV